MKRPWAVPAVILIVLISLVLLPLEYGPTGDALLEDDESRLESGTAPTSHAPADAILETVPGPQAPPPGHVGGVYAHGADALRDPARSESLSSRAPPRR